MSQERVLREATFSPHVVRYKGISACVGLAATIFGIPLIPVALPLTVWYWRKQYGRMRVVLTSRDLKVQRGVFVREEKTIPLEKITDLAVFDGPIMRRFGLRGIRVETAGQTAPAGALVSVVGIEETDSFRDLVLAQRDRIADAGEALSPGLASAGGVDQDALLEALRAIHETLQRIEGALTSPDLGGSGEAR